MYIFYEVVNNPTPSLRQSVKGEYKHIYECYISKYVLYLHIQYIQHDSITLYKGKISIKILFGTRLYYS